MKILKTAKYIKKAQMSGQYENVVFAQGDDAAEPLRILETQGEQAALEYLTQWHNPGEHETRNDVGAGESDRSYRQGQYIMTYNERLGYIGLVYDTMPKQKEVGEQNSFDEFEPYRNKLLG